MPRLHEEFDVDNEAFISLRTCDVVEDEVGIVVSKTKSYRKKYADKYKLLKQEEKRKIEETRREYERDARFDILVWRAANKAENKLLEVVESEVFLDGAKIMCVFYIKKPDTPTAVLEITDYEKWELDYKSTELAKEICKIIRGKNER